MNKKYLIPIGFAFLSFCFILNHMIGDWDEPRKQIIFFSLLLISIWFYFFNRNKLKQIRKTNRILFMLAVSVTMIISIVFLFIMINK